MNLRMDSAWVVPVVLVLVCLALYWPGLSGPMLMDDIPQLAPMLDADNLQRRGELSFLWSNSGLFGRPVSMATFLLNAVSAGDRLFFWKATNLALHLVNGLLLFVFLRQLFTFALRPGGDEQARHLALVATALWLLHPLHVSTVLYTVQRMTELSALFVLAGLAAYVHARARQVAGTSDRAWLLIAFLVFFPLAVLSKENGLLLPVLLGLMEVYFFRLAGSPADRRLLIGLFVVFLALPFLVGAIYLALGFDTFILAGYEGRPFTLGERLLSQPRALVLYLFQLLVPVQRNMGFFHDDFAISHGLLDPPGTLGALVLCLVLLALAWRVRARAPLVGAGALFFFLGHLTDSTIYPLELVFEHRNYLPSAGLFMALVAVAGGSTLGAGLKRTLLVAALLLLSAVTWLRAETWATEDRLYAYALYAHPGSNRAAAEVAERLTRAGGFDEALSLLAPRQGSGPLFHSLYIRCRRDGQLPGRYLSRAESALSGPLDTYTVASLLAVARLGLDGECTMAGPAIVAIMGRALSLPIRDAASAHKLRVYKAIYHWERGEFEQSLAAVEQAVGRNPGDPVPYFMAAEWALSRGEVRMARRYFNSALQIAASAPAAYGDFKQRIGLAITHYEKQAQAQ